MFWLRIKKSYLGACLFGLKKILTIRVGFNKMLVGIANREDPDQTASSEAV